MVTNQNGLNRRAKTCLAVKLGCFVALAAALYSLQIVGEEQYANLSQKNKTAVRLRWSPRRGIVDQNGEVLAGTVQRFRMVFWTRFGAPYACLQGMPEEVRNARGPVVVQDRLNWDTAAASALELDEGGPARLEAVPMRTYPQGALAAHFLGHVGSSERGPNGRFGLEKHLDGELFVPPVQEFSEVNAKRLLVRTFLNVSPAAPLPLKTTLNMRLQRKAVALLKPFACGAVVMVRVSTGEILVYASHPSYDPNVFVEGISKEKWAELQAAQNQIFLDRVGAGQYGPASTVKMAVLLTALSDKGVAPNTRIHCPGFLDVGDRRFHCMARYGHGTLNMKQALAASCDVYFYTLALTLNHPHFIETLQTLGLGSVPAPAFSGWRAGLLPTPENKKARGEKFFKGDVVMATIGHGLFLATPLQLVLMIARIASGKNVQLTVTPPASPPVFDALPFDPQHLKWIREGMGMATKANGTAERLENVGIPIFGKTGTGQVAAWTKEQRAEGLHLKPQARAKRDHSLFGGYSGDYAVFVVLPNAGTGGTAAAPLAGALLKHARDADPSCERLKKSS